MMKVKFIVLIKEVPVSEEAHSSHSSYVVTKPKVSNNFLCVNIFFYSGVTQNITGSIRKRRFLV